MKKYRIAQISIFSITVLFLILFIVFLSLFCVNTNYRQNTIDNINRTLTTNISEVKEAHTTTLLFSIIDPRFNDNAPVLFTGDEVFDIESTAESVKITFTQKAVDIMRTQIGYPLFMYTIIDGVVEAYCSPTINEVANPAVLTTGHVDIEHFTSLSNQLTEFCLPVKLNQLEDDANQQISQVYTQYPTDIYLDLLIFSLVFLVVFALVSVYFILPRKRQSPEPLP